MLYIFHPLWLVALAASAQASTITVGPRATPVINAIIPTTAGQIGINPVEEDIGDPDIYRGTIQHADSKLITIQDTSTHWLAKHIDYLTETTTQGTTSTIQLSVSTAAVAAAGVAVGDISIILAEGLADKVAQAADAAVKACNVLSLKARKRDNSLAIRDIDAGLSCLLNKGAEAYADGGIFSVVNPAEWEAIGAEISANAVPLMAAAFQLAKTQARKAMLAIFMAAVSINIETAAAVGAVGGAVVVGKFVIPKTGFGTPTTTNDNNKKCDPATAKKNINSPLCTDTDCNGNPDTEKCTVDPNKNCPCLVVFDPIPQLYDTGYFDQQQAYLHSVDALPDPSPPKTIQNADPITVNAPTPSPTCGSNGKSAPSVNFDINIPKGKDGIAVHLPIANAPGTWTVGFDKADSITFWQVDAGATNFVPITNGNNAPPNGKIVWTVRDGNPTTNTVVTLFFSTGNLNLKGTISGQQTCTPPATGGGDDGGSTGTPNPAQCISDCNTIITQLQSTYGDTISITSSSDLSKMVDYATGTSNTQDNDWWRISSHGNCFLMVGKDASHRGFPDPIPPINRQDLINFINARVNYACINANPFLVSTPPTNFGGNIGFGQFCLTNFDNYRKCTGHVPAPS